MVELLHNWRVRNKASSLVYYVRDPFWHRKFTPFATIGIRVQGLQCSLLEQREDFSAPTWIHWIPDSTKSELLKTPRRHKCSGHILCEDFVTRERVRSTCRIVHHRVLGGRVEPQAVLFVNFNVSTDWTETLRREVMSASNHLTDQLDSINAFLRRRAEAMLPFLTGLLDLKESADLRNLVFDPDHRRAYYTSLLEICMAACELRQDKGDLALMGTLAPPDKMRLVAQVNCPDVEPLLVVDQQPEKGQPWGLSALSTVIGRPVLIPDLDNRSDVYNDVNLETSAAIKRILAVPLMAHGQVTGALSLEATWPAERLTQPTFVQLVCVAARDSAVTLLALLDAEREWSSRLSRTIRVIRHSVISSLTRHIADGAREIARVHSDVALQCRTLETYGAYLESALHCLTEVASTREFSSESHAVAGRTFQRRCDLHELVDRAILVSSASGSSVAPGQNKVPRGTTVYVADWDIVIALVQILVNSKEKYHAERVDEPVIVEAKAGLAGVLVTVSDSAHPMAEEVMSVAGRQPISMSVGNRDNRGAGLGLITSCLLIERQRGGEFMKPTHRISAEGVAIGNVISFRLPVGDGVK